MGDQSVPTEEMMNLGSNETPIYQKVIAAKRDILGEAAMLRPNGASYEDFADAIPPLRYSDGTFKCYPIVLGIPGAEHKARFVSDGSAVNAWGEKDYWTDVGFPVTFSVGDETFGQDLHRLDGPRYAQGYLPIVQASYRAGDLAVAEETFAGVEEPFGAHAGVFVRFALKDGKRGTISAQIGKEGQIEAADGLLECAGKALVWFGRDWKWDEAGRRLTCEISSGHDAFLAVFTDPVEFRPKSFLGRSEYEDARKRCAKYWNGLLGRGTHIVTPEPLVNNAWRSLVIGTFMLRKGDMMGYSAGNGYERLFEAECGDSVRALLLLGHIADGKQMIPPLMAYWQQGVMYHDAGFKLQFLSHYFWLTRDADFVRAQKEQWTAAIDYILKGREKATGLLPRENYCGDIDTQVYSLNSNANAWRGLRDFSAVLAEIGETEESKRLESIAREFREVILQAVEKSERKDVSPPFIPNALFGEEEPYEKLTEAWLGSYWDLLIPYVLGSGIFGDDSERNGWILDYLHQHGGVCMGLIRFYWESTDDLYGLRYVVALLRRDEVDRAQVSFYGKLAQGLTQGTFIGGEGCRLPPIDEFGRHAHLPPNSSSNAHFLWTLRYMMVQDWDIDDDGRPDTLRLMYATPRRWLEDGKTIGIERAPTAFGEVSVVMTSRLRKGEVTADVTAPKESPKKMLLRARLPEGWKVKSASVGGKSLPVDPTGAADLTGVTGRFTIKFGVAR